MIREKRMIPAALKKWVCEGIGLRSQPCENREKDAVRIAQWYFHVKGSHKMREGMDQRDIAAEKS
jgi:hypothetical protein